MIAMFLTLSFLVQGCARQMESSVSEAPFGARLDDPIRLTLPSSVPDEIHESIAALNVVVAHLAVQTDLDRATIRWDATPNGRGLVMYCFPNPFKPGQPRGVYAWPDWRHADAFAIFESYTYCRILSNHHLELWHDDRSDSVVVDVQDPQRIYAMPSARGAVRIADDGRWVVGSGQMVLRGELGIEAPQGEIRLNGRALSIVLLRSGRILVVDTGDRLESYDLATGVRIDCVPGRIKPILWTDTAFVAKRQRQTVIVSVDEAGDMDIDVAGWKANERPFDLSPSGRFVFSYQDGIWPGELSISVRNAVTADASWSRPTLPSGSVQGWLAW